MRALTGSKFLCAALLFFPYGLYAQHRVPALEREVTLKVTDEPISEVLSRISTQASIKFSYNPRGIPVSKKISISLYKKPVRTVLRAMFGETVSFRQRGNFIILMTHTVPPAREVTVSGYVYNDRGEKLASASIVAPGSSHSAVSDRYGYYSMKVPAHSLPLKVKVEKENYSDTTLNIQPAQQETDLVIRQESAIPPQQSLPESAATIKEPAPLQLSPATLKKDNKFWGSFFLSDKALAHVRNVKDTLFSHVQFSLVPFMSSNKLLVGKSVNDYSVNIIAGYSGGVRVAEFGGLLNVDRGDVRSFQAAGVANAVRGNVTGVQLAGVANLNGGSGSGLRAAGMINAGHHMDGVQLAGIANVNAGFVAGIKKRDQFLIDTVKGFQAAGIININAGYAEGARIAGIYNAGNSMQGFQAAGTLNANTGPFAGTQIAGTMNLSLANASGIQIAGVANISIRRVHGFQLAVFNQAGHIKGVQLGIVNFSDSCDGIPLGLFSYSRHGYRRLELMADEVIHTQLVFRTGVERFHNIFLLGVDPASEQLLAWTGGYGIGTTQHINQRWIANADLITQLLFRDSVMSEKYSPQLTSLHIGLEARLGKHMSVEFGPSLRMLFSYPASPEHAAAGTSYIPYSIAHTTTENGTDITVWVGGRVSLRFH